MTSPESDTIQVMDADGQAYEIPKDVWREQFLIPELQKAWNNPDALYMQIIQALRDGLVADVQDAALHLYVTDPNPTRGAVTLGIVHMEMGRLAEAEKVFTDYLARHGKDGYILTNLAKVYEDQKRPNEPENTLWQAIETDPNQENAVGWYTAIQREKRGEAAELEALSDIAALPGSWRAHMWLGRAALQKNDLVTALEHYERCLAGTQTPVPTDVLVQISGDLGYAGKVNDLIALIAPRFDLQEHGLMVGNNLLKAYTDLKKTADAKVLLDALESQNRPDWQETLDYWKTQI